MFSIPLFCSTKDKNIKVEMLPFHHSPSIAVTLQQQCKANPPTCHEWHFTGTEFPLVAQMPATVWGAVEARP